MLKVPGYIERSGVRGAPVTYEWSAGLDMVIAEKPPANLKKAVDALSVNATYALAVGVAEWLRWRLDGVSARKETARYIEALWAADVDDTYLTGEPEPSGDEDEAANGALCGAEALVSTATNYARANHPNRGKSTAGLAAFVRHTLPDPKPFDAWLKETLTRFAQTYPYNRKNPGPIVPRAFLDPAVPIELSQVARLLDEQLQSISPKGNPYLASVKELEDRGFDGTPYRYRE
jgi:hypothetical protein